ncbi:hypothetical protein [Flagellimonas flava]|uniref:hypothetical protein n=1 Tax=Flagellimonas flava TaxID=570519 RepID=UPI003D64FAB5
MKPTSITSLAFIITFCFSCSTPKFVTRDDSYQRINLDLNPAAIIIEDKRENVAVSDDLKIPFFSKGGQYDMVAPPLDNNHENIIRQTILDNLSSQSTKSVILKAQVLEARKEFSATFWYEKETSYVELKITININGKEIEVIEAGEFYKKSADATYKRSDRIFDNALKEVTYRALKRLEKSAGIPKRAAL